MSASRRRSAVALVALLVACASKTPPASAPSDAAAPPTVERELLLWRVSKGDAVSHLMGTCHLGWPLASFLPDPAPIDRARKVYVELDMASLAPAELLPVILDHTTSQRERLGRARFAQIARTLPGLPAPMLDRMPDWVIYSTQLLTSMDPEGMAAAATTGQAPLAVDQQVVSRARERGVEIGWVETLDQQVAMMAALEIDLATPISVEDQQLQSEVLTATARLCARGDTAVAPMLTAEFDPANEILFERRNLAWFEALEPELAQGGAFVAVGAGHMLGPTGLVARAEQAGYTVERLRGEVVEQPMPDWGGVAELPTDAVLPSDVVDQLTASVVPNLCAAGSFVPTCMIREGEDCGAVVTRGVELCIDQFAASPEALGTLTGSLGELFTACVLTVPALGVQLEGPASDAPECAALAAP